MEEWSINPPGSWQPLTVWRTLMFNSWRWSQVCISDPESQILDSPSFCCLQKNLPAKHLPFWRNIINHLLHLLLFVRGAQYGGGRGHRTDHPGLWDHHARKVCAEDCWQWHCPSPPGCAHLLHNVRHPSLPAYASSGRTWAVGGQPTHGERLGQEEWKRAHLAPPAAAESPTDSDTAVYRGQRCGAHPKYVLCWVHRGQTGLV